MKLLIVQLFHSPVTSSSLEQIFSLGTCSQTPSVYDLPLMFHIHTKQLAKLWFLYFKLGEIVLFEMHRIINLRAFSRNRTS
jgi:hypothetical protein